MPPRTAAARPAPARQLPTRAERRRARATSTERGPRPPITAPRAALAYLVLAVVFLAPALRPGSQLGGIDWSGAGFPVLEFVGRALEAGRMPSWIPGIYGGLPVFANPGSTFHPLRLLLAAVLPAGHVLAGFLVAHFVLAGTGGYLLLRELGARGWVAFTGGLAFEFTGALASLLYAGHDGRFIVAASAPMVLWAIWRGARTGAPGPFALLAALLGGVLLGFQLQSAYYLLVVGGAWATFALVRHDVHRRPALLARRVALGLGAVALAFAMAAVNLLPFASYVEESPRAGAEGRGYAFSTSYSMPPQETLGLAVPEQAGLVLDYRGPNPLKYHTEYAGALVVLLTILGVLVARDDRRWRFFALLAVLALTVAWGGFTPLHRVWTTLLPGSAKFRAPGIAIWVVALGLVLAASLVLERLAALRDDAGAELARAARLAARAVAALCALALVAGAIQRLEHPGLEAGAGWLRFAVATAITGGALVLWLRRVVPTRAVAVALALATVIDLWVIDRRFLLVMDEPAQLYAADDVVDFLRSRPDLGRAWVFPQAAPGESGYLGNGQFGVHSNYLLHHGIPQAGGEHGNQLRRWNEYVGTDSTRALDWHNFMQRPAMLAAAGVGYVVSRVDLSQYREADGSLRPSGLVRVHTGSAAVFRNERAMGRAYVVPAAEPAADAIAAMRRPTWDPRRSAIVEAPLATVPATPPAGVPPSNVVLVADAADSTVVWTAAEQPMLLVVADNFYPGWEATVDGTPVPVVRANHTFRAVEVGAGAHEVRFHFRPAPLLMGMRVSLAATAVLALWGLAAGALAWRARRVAAAA